MLTPEQLEILATARVKQRLADRPPALRRCDWFLHRTGGFAEMVANERAVIEAEAAHMATASGPAKAEDASPSMLTIGEAAAYCGVTEKTIRNRIATKDGDKPLLPGVTGKGRLTRIPRISLDPYRKNTPPKQKTARQKKPVKTK